MLIGLISDTHIPEVARELPDQIREVFRGVDMILHAGDMYTVSVLDELRQLAPVLAAEGDDDYPDILRDGRVKMKHILTVDSVTIWLQHIGVWLWPYDSVGARLRAEEDPDVEITRCPDVVVCGHTHIAKIENSGGVLVTNPGSPTFPSYRRELGTVVLLNTYSGKPEAQIIQLH